MLAALATDDDLFARNITVPGEMDETALLAAASSEVRDAAGCPISQIESTVTLVACDWDELDLPGVPIISVSSVQVDGEDLAGWQLFGDALLLPCGWTRCLPANVTVTYTHGLPEVPADIVDLVCGLVAIAINQNGDYGGSGKLASIRLGDYSESYVQPGGADSPSPMALSQPVRERLRARFGGSVAVLRTR